MKVTKINGFKYGMVKKVGGCDSITCVRCGGTIEEGDKVVRVDGLNGYSADGMCKYWHFDDDYNCNGFDAVGYHHTRKENIVGTHNTTWYREGRISVELEAVSSVATDYYLEAMDVVFDNIITEDGETINNRRIDKDYQYIYVTCLLFGSKALYDKGEKAITQDNEHDCTVTHEGHRSQNNLKGFSKWIHGLTPEMLDCLRHPDAGCHIHMECDYPNVVNQYGDILFTPLFERIKAMSSDERIEKFGRDFTHYASRSIGFHGDCINWHTNHNTVEFRLAHVNTADQIIQCCKWWRYTINLINKKGHKVTTPRKATTLANVIEHSLNYWDTLFAKGR